MIGMAAIVTRVPRAVGDWVIRLLFEVGGLFMMIGAIFRRMLPPRLDGKETWRAFYRVGVKSFPIVVVTAILTGAIMAIQAASYIEQTGAYGLLGWGAGFAIMREVGPILIGLMFSGRVGANNTAELGTMKVTEQIDALRTLAIDPISYLVMPRFFAMVIMMVLLVVVGDLTALVGGAVTSQLLIGVSIDLFFNSLLEYVVLMDFLSGVFKAGAFGFAIAIVSCHFGISVRGGAVGVGRAVNNSVVITAISIFILDFILTYLME
jgi:phospholipid/cholesterol/gamma-HCH transport system permease protein